MAVRRRRRLHRTRKCGNDLAALCLMEIGQGVRKWQLPTCSDRRLRPSVHVAVHMLMLQLRQHEQQHFLPHAARSELLLAARVARDWSCLYTADEHADRACTWIVKLPQHMLTAHGIRDMEHKTAALTMAHATSYVATMHTQRLHTYVYYLCASPGRV